MRERGSDFDDEEEERGSFNLRDYQWSETANLLREYARENHWVRDGEEPNYVKIEDCRQGKYAYSPKGRSSKVEPYLFVWFLQQIGLRIVDGKFLVLTGLQKQTLEDMGASFTEESKTRIREILGKNLEKSKPKTKLTKFLGDAYKKMQIRNKNNDGEHGDN